VPIAPDALPDNPAALKRIIAGMAQDALTAEAEIARLKFSWLVIVGLQPTGLMGWMAPSRHLCAKVGLSTTPTDGSHP
jgi:hypothetical protein